VDEPAGAGCPASVQLEPRGTDAYGGREPGSPPRRGPGVAKRAVAAASPGRGRPVGGLGCRAGGIGGIGMAQAHLATVSPARHPAPRDQQRTPPRPAQSQHPAIPDRLHRPRMPHSNIGVAPIARHPAHTCIVGHQNQPWQPTRPARTPRPTGAENRPPQVARLRLARVERYCRNPAMTFRAAGSRILWLI